MTEEYLALTLIGPPTSGKSSIAQDISREHLIPLVRGKNILPNESALLETERHLIPDTIYIPALLKFLHDFPGPVILENIPRTVPQAEALIKWSEETRHLLITANLILSLNQVENRAAVREVCPICDQSFHPQLRPSSTPGFCPEHNVALVKKAGDSPETVKRGFSDHLIQDMPILNYLKHHNQLILNLDANSSLRQTQNRIINDLLRNHATKDMIKKPTR